MCQASGNEIATSLSRDSFDILGCNIDERRKRLGKFDDKGGTVSQHGHDRPNRANWKLAANVARHYWPPKAHPAQFLERPRQSFIRVEQT